MSELEQYWRESAAATQRAIEARKEEARRVQAEKVAKESEFVAEDVPTGFDFGPTKHFVPLDDNYQVVYYEGVFPELSDSKLVMGLSGGWETVHVEQTDAMRDKAIKSGSSIQSRSFPQVLDSERDSNRKEEQFLENGVPSNLTYLDQYRHPLPDPQAEELQAIDSVADGD
jgi:hypothetical protein